jgi:hypothetical protein
MFAGVLRQVLRVLIVTVALGALAPSWTAAQTAPAARPALTADDYARAERFMSYNTAPLVLHGAVQPDWASKDGDRFWYRSAVEGGFEFVLVDPATKTRKAAFDHAKVAAALSNAAGKPYEAGALPFSRFGYTQGGQGIRFVLDARPFTCDASGASCSAGQAERRPEGAGATRDVTSPDGRLAAFIKQDNLWVRDTATGQERALTTDGVKDFGYATDNAGWRHSDAPVLLWSPDSRKIATFQQDQRGVGEMYLVETKVGRPNLRAWKYPLPGDETVAMLHRVVIHLDGPKVVRLEMGPDQHRGTVTDDIRWRGLE